MIRYLEELKDATADREAVQDYNDEEQFEQRQPRP
jgi:hypothetical protein